jgi:hypothetical protein
MFTKLKYWEQTEPSNLVHGPLQQRHVLPTVAWAMALCSILANLGTLRHPSFEEMAATRMLQAIGSHTDQQTNADRKSMQCCLISEIYDLYRQ